MKQERLKIYNGQLITPYKTVKNGAVLIENGKVLAVQDGNPDFPEAHEIDAKGHYVAPGFIDLHVHGGGGHDFMDNTVEAFLGIAETHARYGTTAMCPTTLTSEKEDLLETLRVYEEAVPLNKKGAQFIGMHLEGPYFALSQRGAQDPRYIRNPDPKEYKEILSATSVVKRWSAAPELEGAIEFGRYLKSKGVLAAIAHTDAIYEEVQEAFENGYSLLTHFYSSMSGVTRKECFRYAGVIESGYLIDEMDVEIIADGVHLPAPLLKLIYKIKGASHTALITDAMRGAGMPPGESILGSRKNGLKVIIEDDVAKLPDRSSFAGSVATADRLVRNMVNLAGVSIEEAVRMMSKTPARIMGLAEVKGSLTPGKDADVVIFDEQINVQYTIVNGRVIYNK